jgi:hypothetical protein
MIIVKEKRTQEAVNFTQLKQDVDRLFQKWNTEFAKVVPIDKLPYMFTVLMTTIQFLTEIKDEVHRSRKVPEEIWDSFADGRLFALEKILETSIGEIKKLYK